MRSHCCATALTPYVYYWRPGKKLCAGAREVENGGHVLKDTTSR
jgi:hypothetical protein